MIKSAKLAQALRDQISREYQSAHLYLSLASKLHYLGYTGFARFFERHAGEELAHGRKIHDYLIQQRQLVTHNVMETGSFDLGTVESAVTAALEHEETITKAICDLCDLAVAEGDHATCIFLQWFVTEQVEEEDVFSTLLDRVLLADGKTAALLILDHELAH